MSHQAYQFLYDLLFMVSLIMWKLSFYQLIVGTSTSIQNMESLVLLFYRLPTFKKTSSNHKHLNRKGEIW